MAAWLTVSVVIVSWPAEAQAACMTGRYDGGSLATATVACSGSCSCPTPIDGTNAKCYADRYPDLKAAFGYNTNALIGHYNRHGKTEGRTFNCAGQLSKTVDTSACKFMNDHVVYITSVGGLTDHWR
jgi:hypothetical protein